MDKARVRLTARLVLYVGVACFAWAFLQGLRLWNGVDDPGRVTGLAAIAATVGFVLVMPAGFALAMAKE